MDYTTTTLKKNFDLLKGLRMDGRYFSFCYTSNPSELKASVRNLFLKKVKYVCQASNYHNYKAVIGAKAAGTLKDGNAATKNEVKVAGTEFIYKNIKTNKVKLRIPVRSISEKGADYYILSQKEMVYKKVDKETFYAGLELVGWKKREKKPPQDFRSFDLYKISITEK